MFPETTTDVNQSGISLPPGVPASGQDIDNINIATQPDHGDVINNDPEDDGRGYKNKYVEADRKRQLAEDKAKMMEEVLIKFGGQAKTEEKLVLPSIESSSALTTKELALLKVSDDYIRDLEQSSPEQAANIRAAKLDAYHKKNNYDREAMKQEIKNEVVREAHLEQLTKNYPALNDANSLERKAFVAEYKRLASDGYKSPNIVMDALDLAKVRRPDLFSVKNMPTQTQATRDSSLSQHRVGSSSSTPIGKPKEFQLTEKELITINEFGTNQVKVSERLKTIRETNAKFAYPRR